MVDGLERITYDPLLLPVYGNLRNGKHADHQELQKAILLHVTGHLPEEPRLLEKYDPESVRPRALELVEPTTGTAVSNHGFYLTCARLSGAEMRLSISGEEIIVKSSYLGGHRTEGQLQQLEDGLNPTGRKFTNQKSNSGEMQYNGLTIIFPAIRQSEVIEYIARLAQMPRLDK